MKVNGQLYVPNSFNGYYYYYYYYYYWANKIREDEMGGGRGTYNNGENKCILACGWKRWRQEITVKA